MKLTIPKMPHASGKFLRMKYIHFIVIRYIAGPSSAGVENFSTGVENWTSAQGERG